MTVKCQRTIRVLSLDWDWFFSYGEDGTLERLLPDPLYEECSREIITEIWASRYLWQTEGKTAFDLAVSQEKLRRIHSLLESLPHGMEAAVAESHLSLYPFLKSIYPDADFDIIQYDHHHDLCPVRNGTPDSGSWAAALMAEGRLHSFLWVGNPSSVTDCGGTPVLARYPSKVRFTTDPKAIDGAFDVLFLCRSLIWAPPHADREFRRLLRKITACAGRMQIAGRQESRLWSPSFFADVEQAARRQAFEALLSGYCPEDAGQSQMSLRYLPQELKQAALTADTAAFERFSSGCSTFVSKEMSRLMRDAGMGRSAAYRKALNRLIDME